MDFQYRDIRVADIEMLRYEVTGFDDLTPQQRTFIYHLSEAALWGRDILWHQHCHVNLDVRTLLETLYTTNAEARRSEAFCTYLRRVWFANGIHHHYSMDKFQPAFTRDWLLRRMQESNVEASDDVLLAIFDEQYLSKRVSQAVGTDLITSSACNFYGQGVTQAMAEEFYDAQRVNDTDEPVMHGMNSRLELVDGRLQERTWHVGGMYGPTIERIVEHLRAAQDACENEAQRTYIATLIDFYETGDLATFDRYCIQWLSATEGDVDFVNGFIETYGDPLGLKASWEGYVNIRDHKASRRTATLSSNAQWFEDNSPVDPRFKMS